MNAKRGEQKPDNPDIQSEANPDTPEPTTESGGKLPTWSPLQLFFGIPITLLFIGFTLHLFIVGMRGQPPVKQPTKPTQEFHQKDTTKHTADTVTSDSL